MIAKLINPIDVHVGMRIRMWRTERKISRIALGEAVGLTDQQIQKYEMGADRIGASRLQQICKVLEIPVSFLFEGALGSPPGKSSMPREIVDFLASPEGARFVAAFSRIADRKVRRGIARLVNRIADHVGRISAAQSADSGAAEMADYAALIRPTGLVHRPPPHSSISE
jgi:transcriptional regulator with XRE-family HTH domain